MLMSIAKIAVEWQRWRIRVICPRASILSLVAVLLLLPSCATVCRNEVTPAAQDPVISSIDPMQTTECIEDRPVVQVAYSQESDNAGVKLEPIPSEVSTVSKHLIDFDAGSSSLSLDDLEQMALAHNPGLSEAMAQVAAMRGKWLQSGLPPNPRLGYSGAQLGSAGEAEQQGIYIEQEMIRGGKLCLDQAVASQEISHAEHMLEVRRRRVLTDVRIGYYQVQCAQKRLELAGELVKIGNQATEVVERLFEKLEGSRRDLLQARIESKSALNVLQRAQNQHTSAWRMLAAVLGSPQMPPRPLTGELDEAAGELVWEHSLERLLTESPEISAALVEIERARIAFNRASVESVPDVNLQGVFQHDNSTGGSNGALLISIPIPILNRNQGGIRRAESELTASQRAAERLELDLQYRLAPVFERYHTGRNRVGNYRGGILADAQESLKLTRQGYEAGELSFLNLLTAQRTYFQANLDFIEALCDMWAASAEIEGLLLMDSLK